MKNENQKAVIEILEKALKEAKEGKIYHMVLGYTDESTNSYRTIEIGKQLMLLGLTQGLTHEVFKKIEADEMQEKLADLLSEFGE